MRSRVFDARRLAGWLLPALAISQGLQLLRVFLASLVWYLRDTRGLPTLSLIPYAFGTFLVGFAAAEIRRAVGPRRALWISAGGLALLRLVEQIVQAPAIDLWLSTAGVAALLTFLPVYLGHLRATAADPAWRLAFGLVLGLGADIGLRGAFGTLDLSWIAGPVPLAVSVLLSALTLWAVRKEPPTVTEAASEVGWLQAVPLLAIGPYLLLQLLRYQSQGWLEAVSGLQPPLGFVLVMFGNLLAAGGVAWGLARPRTQRPLLAAAVGVYLALTSFPQSPAEGVVVAVLLGQALMGWGWAALATATAPADRTGLARTTFGLVGGMLLFLALAFAYYLPLDVVLPFSRHAIPPVAGGLFGLMLLLATAGSSASRRVGRVDLTGVAAAAGLVLVPLIQWAVRPAVPQPEAPHGLPVRVMTYNIHSGFSSSGRLDPEAIAKVIEGSRAEIVALQEVPRVRLLDGEADLASWLSRRLDMPFVFRGTEEPIWGNALLARYPIVESGWGDLPRNGTLIGRGYLWVRVDIGEPSPLLVITTHLHHREQDGVVRQAQVRSLLTFWAGQADSVLLGDLNAEPDALEMQTLAEAGLVDSWRQAGGGPGYTYSARQPFQRIDWIWHSDDLFTHSAEVLDSQASDHLPLLVTLGE